jgi:hypothetical protein
MPDSGQIGRNLARTAGILAICSGSNHFGQIPTNFGLNQAQMAGFQQAQMTDHFKNNFLN